MLDIVDVRACYGLRCIYQVLPGDVVLYLPEAERVGELKSDAQPRAGSANGEAKYFEVCDDSRADERTGARASGLGSPK